MCNEISVDRLKLWTFQCRRHCSVPKTLPLNLFKYHTMILCGSGKEDVTRQIKGTDNFHNGENLSNFFANASRQKVWSRTWRHKTWDLRRKAPPYQTYFEWTNEFCPFLSQKLVPLQTVVCNGTRTKSGTAGRRSWLLPQRVLGSFFANASDDRFGNLQAGNLYRYLDKIKRVGNCGSGSGSNKRCMRLSYETLWSRVANQEFPPSLTGRFWAVQDQYLGPLSPEIRWNPVEIERSCDERNFWNSNNNGSSASVS